MIQGDLPAKAEGTTTIEVNQVTEATQGTFSTQGTHRDHPSRCRGATQSLQDHIPPKQYTYGLHQHTAST